jgi:hypothetical protein
VVGKTSDNVTAADPQLVVGCFEELLGNLAFDSAPSPNPFAFAYRGLYTGL